MAIQKDWEKRMYVPATVYPEQARRPSAKEKWSAVTTRIPEQAEFTPEIPTDASNSLSSDLLKQSEHKKPYKSKGYEQMEYELEPPPGFSDIPPGWVPPPGVPWPTPTGDGVIGGGLPFIFVFDIDPVVVTLSTDPQWSAVGEVCPGTWTLIDLQPTHPVVLVELPFAPSGTQFRYPGSGKDIIEVLIPGNIGWNGLLRIRAYMEADNPGGAINPVPGLSEANIDIASFQDERCPSQYFDIKISVNTGAGIYERSFVWDMWREEIPTDIPDGIGGTLTLPVLDASLAYWRGLVPSIGSKDVTIGRSCSFSQDVLPPCDTGLDGIGDDYTDVIYWRCGFTQFYDSAGSCEVICSFCNTTPPPIQQGDCFTTITKSFPLLTSPSALGSGEWAYGFTSTEYNYEQVFMYETIEVFFEANIEVGGACVDTGIVPRLSHNINWYIDVQGDTFGAGAEAPDRFISLISGNNLTLASDYYNPALDAPENPDSLIHLVAFDHKVEDIGGGNPVFYEEFYADLFYDHTGFIHNNQLNRPFADSRKAAFEAMVQQIIDDAKVAFPAYTQIALSFTTQLHQGVYKI